MCSFWKNEKIKNRILRGAAVLVALGLLCLFFKEEKKEKQYDIVFLGDSIAGTLLSDVSITTTMEERLGMSVFNGAFGGSTMSVQNAFLWSSAANVEWSMVKLAEAICYDDWQNQRAAMAYAENNRAHSTQALEYFAPKMEELMQIDFSQVEILIIEHGTNDYNSGQVLDNPENRFDETTYGGALRQTIMLLQKTYPDLRIVLVSPIYCGLGEGQKEKCYNTAYGNGEILDEYVFLEKQIAEEFGVEWIDAYHESGIWEDTADIYLHDELHLLEAGQILMGNFIADYLEETEK